MNRKNAGFTLIEIMMVVIIIGILSAIAIPSYSEYLIRSRIAQATSGLAGRRVVMEQFFQDRHFYDQPAAGGNPAITSPGCLNIPPSQYFDFSCAALTATTYTLTATGKSSMTGFTYTVNQTNVKATTAALTGWGTSTTCWVTSKGGGC